jgi:hypothetical protein
MLTHMQRAWLKIGVGCAIAGAAILFAAAVATRVKHSHETDTVSDEQKVARTLEIIRTSTPTDHKVLKVLFFGQSITHSGWDKAVIEHWHQTYPNTVFVVQNRALGGFASPELLRTTEQNIAAFYPDLIIFHVYGDHRAYEKIIRLFRSRTAADVIVQTDHGEVLPDPPCDEGLHLTLHRPPGCRGFLWLRQRIWGDEMSYHKIPEYAKTYGLAVEPQRGWWRDYLISTHTQPEALLVDTIHPNAKGKELLAQFFNQYFDNLVQKWNGEHEDGISKVAASPQKDGAESIQFDGSRLELISTAPLPATPAATIDGHPAKDVDGCYQVTRASSIATVPDWPAVRRITLKGNHTAEDWTATITKLSSDQKTFEFDVHGSVSGDEGHGDSGHDFVSKSGNLSIEAQDWMFARAFDLKHTPIAAPYEVHWSVIDVCDSGPEVIDLGNGQKQYRYVLGADLSNATHTIAIPPIPVDLNKDVYFLAYKPGLHE